MTDFESKVHGSHVLVYNQGPYYRADDFVVYWSAEVEARSWGLKSIDTTVKRVHGFFTVLDKEDNELAEFELDQDGTTEWRIIDSLTNDPFGGIAPSEICIDFAAKTIEVS